MFVYDAAFFMYPLTLVMHGHSRVRAISSSLSSTIVFLWRENSSSHFFTCLYWKSQSYSPKIIQFFIAALDIGEVHGEHLHNCDEAGTGRVTEDGYVQLFDCDGPRREEFLKVVHCRSHGQLGVGRHQRLKAHVPALSSYWSALAY